MSGDLERPRHQHHRRHSRGDRQIPCHAATGHATTGRAAPGRAEAEGERGEAASDQCDYPDQRHERGGHRDAEARCPGRTARLPRRLGENPRRHQRDQRQDHENERAAYPAGRDRSHGHRQQGIRCGGPDPDRREARDPPGGEERGKAGQGHAAKQDHFDGQPRLAARDRGERGDHRQVRGRCGSRTDPGRVKALQVRMPQPGGTARCGHQRAAAERAAAEQRALGHERDHGQPGEKQHCRICQDALRQPGVDQHRVVLGRIFRRMVAACRIELGRPRPDVRGELRQPAQGPARRQVGPQPAVGGTAPAGAPAPCAQQADRMTEHGAAGGELVNRRGWPFRDHEEDHAESRHGDVAGQCGEHRAAWQVPEQGQQRVAPVEAVRAAGYRHGPPVPGRCLHVVGHRVGDDPDPVAGGVHSPAEVDVLPEEDHAGVEAADLIPHVAADQHPGAADC